MSTASARRLEEMQAAAAIAALNPAMALVHANLMDAVGPQFVLSGATTEEIIEWKRSVRYLRVVVAGQLEETRQDT